MGEDVNNISFIPYFSNSFSRHGLRSKLLAPTKSPLVVAVSLLIVSLSLFITPCQTLAEEEYRFERMWPTLQQPYYFRNPTGIAVALDGSVYVGDVQ